MRPPADRGRLTGGVTTEELLWAVANAFVALGLISFAVLKEDPEFWRNSGGWPVWFRFVVKFTFHPLVVVQAILHGFHSIRTVRRDGLNLGRLGRLGLVWILWGTATALSVEDNVVELFQR